MNTKAQQRPLDMYIQQVAGAKPFLIRLRFISYFLVDM